MKYIAIKNLEKYQRYTKRRPPWVKLHQSLLEDAHLMCASCTDRWIAIALLLVASRYDNRIPADLEWLTRTLHMPETVDLSYLLGIGYLVEVVEGQQDSVHTKSVQRAHKTGATRTPNAPAKSTENRVQRTEKELHTAPAALASREPSWMQPVADAWEAVRGVGSFKWKRHAAALASLKPVGGDVVAERLTRYLGATEPRFQSLEHFSTSHGQYAEKPKSKVQLYVEANGPIVDEYGCLTKAGDWLTSPEPNIIAERKRLGFAS